jgi:DnaJ-domain-containing protein 1
MEPVNVCSAKARVILDIPATVPSIDTKRPALSAIRRAFVQPAVAWDRNRLPCVGCDRGATALATQATGDKPSVWKPNQANTGNGAAEQPPGPIRPGRPQQASAVLSQPGHPLDESIKLRIAQLRERSLKIRSAIPFPELLEDWDTDILMTIVSTCRPIGSLSSANIVLWMGLAIQERSFNEARQLMYVAWENFANKEAVVIPRMLILEEKKYPRADLAKSLHEFFVTIVRMAASVETNNEWTITSAGISFSNELIRFTLEAMAERLRGAATPPTEQYVKGPDTAPADPYALLGAPRGCSPDELKAAYLQKVKQWHPDQIQHMAPELRTFADQQLGLINAAYDALKARA